MIADIIIIENCQRILKKVKNTTINFGQVVPYGNDAMVFVIVTKHEQFVQRIQKQYGNILDLFQISREYVAVITNKSNCLNPDRKMFSVVDSFSFLFF